MTGKGKGRDDGEGSSPQLQPGPLGLPRGAPNPGDLNDSENLGDKDEFYNNKETFLSRIKKDTQEKVAKILNPELYYRE